MNHAFYLYEALEAALSTVIPPIIRESLAPYGIKLYSLIKYLLNSVGFGSELNRICCSSNPLGMVLAADRSIFNSTVLKECLASFKSTQDTTSFKSTIHNLKKIELTKEDYFDQCVSAISEFYCTLKNLRELAKTQFDKENEDHEKMLQNLWDNLMPETVLESRLTSQWGEIGFQGKDPCSDFRGMGMLGLTAMLKLSERHQVAAKEILDISHHKDFEYSFAVVAINVTNFTLVSLENNRHLRAFIYKRIVDNDDTDNAFFDLFSLVMLRWARYWKQSRPENIMAFGEKFSEFKTAVAESWPEDWLDQKF